MKMENGHVMMIFCLRALEKSVKRTDNRATHLASIKGPEVKCVAHPIEALGVPSHSPTWIPRHKCNIRSIKLAVGAY